MALLDTARDLACAPVLQELLPLLARRARSLLSADMAFIGVPDGPAGDSRIVTADGAATVLTDGFRLPWRGGLAVSADTREPVHWSPDYLADERIERHPDVDEMVRKEGLRSVLSIPIRLNRRHIADLHIAHRRLRGFTPGEAASARYLAELAAPAIEQARNLENAQLELQRVEEEAVRTLAGLRSVREVLEVQSRLLRLALEGSDIHVLLDDAARELHGSLHVRDTADGDVAAVGGIPPPDENELCRARLHAHTIGRPGRLTTGSWVAPVAKGFEELGCVVYHPHDGEEPDDDRIMLLMVVARLIALLMAQSAAMPQGRLGDELLEELIDKRPALDGDSGRDKAKGGEAAPRRSLELDRPHVVVVARAERRQRTGVLERAISVAHRLGGMKVIRDGCAVLMLPGDDAGARAHQVSQELSALIGAPVKAGAAGPARTADAVGRTYREAVRCLQALTVLEKAGHSASAHELGFLGMLLADAPDVPAFIERVVGPVLSYDARRFTDLTETLEVYFGSACSRTRTAETLHVHPNTVSRRLERITRLLGEDWQRPDHALELQVALRLRRVRDALRRDHGRFSEPSIA